MQPDTLIPGVDSPQSWNRFSYTSNNPINYSDPTGHMEESDDYESGGPTPPIPPINPPSGGGDPDISDNSSQTDVTEWLVNELNEQLNWLNSNDYVCKNSQIWCLDTNLSKYYLAHLNLFGNSGKYNIKIPMQEKIGNAVVLCGGTNCRWVDYSAPGNVMFGYLSAERGIVQPVAWVAGGILESKDNKFINFDNVNSWFDNPGDKAAVDFGWDLHRKYPDGLTMTQFQSELTGSVLATFQSAPLTQQGYTLIGAQSQQNTYSPGYFLQK